MTSVASAAVISTFRRAVAVRLYFPTLHVLRNLHRSSSSLPRYGEASAEGPRAGLAGPSMTTTLSTIAACVKV